MKTIVNDTNNRTWTMRKESKEYQFWTSQYFCSDGDGIELYIENNNSGFKLSCFSGIPASEIYIDVVDFGVLWNKAFKNFDDIKISNYSFDVQCIMLADWLCSLFCEFETFTYTK